MDHLDCARRIEEFFARGAEEVAREEDESRPDPLPRRRQRFARGLRERIEGIGADPPPAGEKTRQPIVDGGFDLGEEAGESVAFQKLESASFSSE